MPVYLVGFDVRNVGAADDYSGLQTAMAKLEKHCLMPGLYLVSVPFTAGALKEFLLNHMCSKDCIWISALHPKAKIEFAYQTTGGTGAWLRKHSRIELPAPVMNLADRANSAPENMLYQRSNGAKVNGGNSFKAAHS